MRWMPLVALLLVPVMGIAKAPPGSKALKRTLPVTVEGKAYDLVVSGLVTPHLDATPLHIAIDASTPVSGLVPMVDRALRSVSEDGGTCENAFAVEDVAPVSTEGTALKVKAKVRVTVRPCADVPDWLGGGRQELPTVSTSPWVEVWLTPSIVDGKPDFRTRASVDFDNSLVNAAARTFGVEDRIAKEARDALQQVVETPPPEAMGGAELVDLRVADGAVHASVRVPATNATFLDLMSAVLGE